VAIGTNPSLLQPEQRVLSTLESDGSRRWLYPRPASGKFLKRRRITAYLLIVLFTAIPYIRINGKPAIFLDLVHRQFTFFGVTFLPTDTVLLALLMVSLFLTIFFVTALFGRAWCGWACPQTVYLEFVYRPLERLFMGTRGIGGKPKNVAGWRIAAMYATFLLVSMYLAHTFLAYFVGAEQLRVWIRQSPTSHPAAFAIMLITTGLMMFDFAFFREQTCIIACPYGRFQSVLMDRQSLIVSYDRTRGETRGKSGTGDCVDCDLCAKACPTGIDIREGSQIECIACAQCIDACSNVMLKLGRKTDLIRFSSQAANAGQATRFLRPRVVIYIGIVAGLLGLLSYLILSRSPLDVTMLRSIGRPFVMTDAGQVENTIRVKLTNRTDKPMRLRFSALNHSDVSVRATQEAVELAPAQSWTEPLLIVAPPGAFTAGMLHLKIRIAGEDGSPTIDREALLLGPTSVAPGGANAKP
jgi:cytochrome c oxidase accessory protein FixG